MELMFSLDYEYALHDIARISFVFRDVAAVVLVPCHDFQYVMGDAAF